jgi:hypothetical protein
VDAGTTFGALNKSLGKRKAVVQRQAKNDGPRSAALKSGPLASDSSSTDEEADGRHGAQLGASKLTGKAMTKRDLLTAPPSKKKKKANAGGE